MIQRFNVLQQSVQDFKAMVADESKANRFINFQRHTESGSYFSSGDDAISAVDFATYDESFIVGSYQPIGSPVVA